MTTKRRTWFGRVFGCSSFSPRGFLVDAVLIALVFLACNLAGLKEYTSVICGTSPTGDINNPLVLGLGAFYLFIHFAFVLVAPILVIAAAVFAILVLVVPPKQKT